MRRDLALWVLLALLASPAVADCTATAGNLLANCHFDSDVAGWSASSGTLTHDASIGNTRTVFAQNGAGRLTTANGSVRMTQCVAVSTATDHVFRIAYRTTDATTDRCTFRLHEYQAPGCPDGTAVATVTGTDEDFSADWEARTMSIEPGASVQSVEVELSCIGRTVPAITHPDIAVDDVELFANNAIVVDGVCTLSDAIRAANTDAAVGSCPAGSGDDVIVLNQNVTLSAGDTVYSSLQSGTYAGLPDPAAGAGLNLEAGAADTIERAESGCNYLSASSFRFFNVISQARLTLRNLTLRNGCARPPAGDAVGGAIYVSAGELTLVGCTSSQNGATGQPGSPNGQARGGFLYQGGGTVTIHSSTFENNTAWGASFGPSGVEAGDAAGGALFLAGGNATIETAVFTQNYATGGVGDNARGGDAAGGAVAIDGATVSIVDTLLQGNGAVGGTGTLSGEARGGAIGLGESGTMPEISRITAIANVARVDHGLFFGGEALGGALYLGGTIGQIANTTLLDNRALGGDSLQQTAGNARGGGLFAAAWTPIGLLTASTISGNEAVGGTRLNPPGGSGFGWGGGLYLNTGNVTATIISDNLSINAPDCRASGPMTSLGYNLIGIEDHCTFSATGDLNGSAQLGPVGDHGCMVPLPRGACLPTAPPGLASPALDAADCAAMVVAEDARQRARPQQLSIPDGAGDGCDIGAFELVAHDARLAISESADPIYAGVDSALSYLLTLANVGGDPLTDIVVTVDCTAPLGVTALTGVASAGFWNGTTWTFAAFAAGATATLELPFEVSAEAAAGTVACDVTTTMTEPDADGAPPAASVATTVIVVRIFQDDFESGALDKWDVTEP